MKDNHFFADVDLPFHVWVREGRRWVLRDARLPSEGEPTATEEPVPGSNRRDSRR